MNTTTICPLDEIPDLQCDACIIDERNTLIFGSFWRRDT